MPVRGRAKCHIIALLYAITHNLIQGVKLRKGEDDRRLRRNLRRRGKLGKRFGNVNAGGGLLA